MTEIEQQLALVDVALRSALLKRGEARDRVVQLAAERDYLRLRAGLPPVTVPEEEVDFDERFKALGEKVYFMGAVFDSHQHRYIVVRRVIHSPFWRAMHNLFAHPFLVLLPPLGRWLHEYTRFRMYEGPQTLSPQEEGEDITYTQD